MGQIRIWHNLNFKKGRTKGLKCKNEDSKQKMDFFSLFWPNMALTQNLDLRPTLVSFSGEKNRKRERRRREEEKEEQEEKKKKGGGVQEGFKGMELLTLCMDPWFCLVNGIPQT